MKIAMIGQKGIPAVYGGVERHVEELSTRLSALGHDVIVYTRPYYTSRLRTNHQGVRLVSLRSLHTKHLDAITHTLMATWHAMKEQADVFHYHGVGPSLVSWIPRVFRPKARVVTTFHSPDRLHQKWGLLARLCLTWGERSAIKFAHETITVSRSLNVYCQERYGKTTTYIPNGVPYMNSAKPSMIDSAFGLKGDDYVLVVTRLVPHKGVHYLIKAHAQLNTTKKLVIVGDSTFTDAYVKQLKHMAGDQVIFTGWQNGQMLAELYSNASVYVQPSESEGLPISVLEAAAYGLPIVASDIPSNMEIVSHCGRSFTRGDVQDLTKVLQNVLHDPQAREDMGRKARKLVQDEYEWNSITEHTARLYQRLLTPPFETSLAAA